MNAFRLAQKVCLWVDVKGLPEWQTTSLKIWMTDGNRRIHEGQRIDKSATQDAIPAGVNSALEGANVGQVSCGDDRESGECDLSEGVS